MVGEDAYAEGSFSEAIELFDELVTSEDFTEFLTLPAYDLID
jgi:malate synthase